MKKRKRRILFLIALSLFAYCCFVFKDSATTLTNEDFIRFHVIANSNSPSDQQLKLTVRDGLLRSINDGLAAETMAMVKPDKTKATLDIDRSKEFIEENLAEFVQEAQAILKREGCSYPVKAELGTAFIPKKTYGKITFPAGNYNALTVTIGEGRGENWWCVLFPPLCLIGLTPEEGANMEELYKEAILDEKYRFLLEDTQKPKTLKLKFKVLELMEE
ncbi:MAG TPA: stage II sporulation protein R [Bacillota bacterium]|nr:stage II sporulation protein R [Bacillota bacterium]